MKTLKCTLQEWVWERNCFKIFSWTDKDLTKAKKSLVGFIGIKHNTKCFLTKENKK